MYSQNLKGCSQVPATGLSQDWLTCCRAVLDTLPQRVYHAVWGSLRGKFILGLVSLVIVLLVSVTLIYEGRQRQAILEQTRLRALAVGASLAALSEGYLLNYNFAKLEQVTENVANGDDDVLYAVAHLRDGKVAAFSGRNDLQGKLLDDPISQRALQAKQPLVQMITIPKSHEPAYDVAIPVSVPGSPQKWGTIRLGFSLQRAYATIRATRNDLFWLGLAATGASAVLAVLLATRISRPVGQLVSAVHAMTGGSYEQPIQVEARDEMGYLASAFEQMRRALQTHLAGLAEEKTHLKETNLRLKETQQQLVHLTARVAHEVNNPLAIIKTAIRLIKKQDAGNSCLNADLQMIEEEISRVSRIIQEMLAFSRPMQPNQVVDVNTVLQSLHSMLEYSLSERQIALRMILEPELPQVPLSADHLKQVILNLIRNAEDAMPEGGQLTVRTTGSGQGVEMRVSDTGCGISGEYLEHLFDPFFTTKETERGMGLGLAVSFSIIRRANGDITVESEVGKGTTFVISLPAPPSKGVEHSAYTSAQGERVC